MPSKDLHHHGGSIGSRDAQGHAHRDARDGDAPAAEPQHREAGAYHQAEPDLFDWAAIRAAVTFVWRSPGRHRKVAGAAFACCVLVAVAAATWLPRTYHTESRIMTTRNLIMPALGNPGRAIPSDADAPTRGAAENILSRDHLEALVEQTNLLERWQAERPALLRLKDWAVAAVMGPPDRDDRLDALVYLLEQRLKVTVVDGLITISLDWPDARTAYQIVTNAQQNFLETRHALEVSTIAEAISILEAHAAEVKARVDADTEALRLAREGRRAVVASPGPAPIARPAARPRSAAEDADLAELANLRVMLVAKQRAVADLEGYRQRRLGELQAQLAELRATYTPAHPLIQATRESMETLQRDSPQVAQLKREEQELAAQVQAQAQKVGPAERAAAAAAPTPLVHEYRAPAARATDDEAADALRMRLKSAVGNYETLVDRIESARIEQDTARAAFKYRYSVVRPAEVTKKPAKPNVAMLLLSGLLLGGMMAFAAPSYLDWRAAAPAATAPEPEATDGGTGAGSGPAA